MKRLAQVTGWGNQSCQVTFGYMPARVHVAQDDSYLDNDNWGYIVSTTICGMDKTLVSAQGKSLEEALSNLIEEIPKKCLAMAERYQEWAKR